MRQKIYRKAHPGYDASLAARQKKFRDNHPEYNETNLCRYRKRKIRKISKKARARKMISFQGISSSLAPTRNQFPRIINEPRNVSILIWGATDTMDIETELHYRRRTGDLSVEYDDFINETHGPPLLKSETDNRKEKIIRTQVGISCLKEYSKVLAPKRRTKICGGCGRIQTNLYQAPKLIALENLGCYRVKITSPDNIPTKFVHHLHVMIRSTDQIARDKTEHEFFSDTQYQNPLNVKVSGPFNKHVYFLVVPAGCIKTAASYNHNKGNQTFFLPDPFLDASTACYISVYMCQQCLTNRKN